jgi:hypothetical protein
MGFEFTYDMGDEIRVYVNPISEVGYAPRMMLLMALRYLWEGKYTDTIDKYYWIYETYMRLRNYKYMSAFSKLQIMCIAHNVGYLLHRNNSDRPGWCNWNTNHTWSTKRKCELLNELPDEDVDNVNLHCTGNTTETISTRLNKETVFEIIKQMS